MAMHRVKEGRPVPGVQRHDTAVASASAEYPLGVSRPPLGVADLPTPEEVFGVPHIGWRELLRHVVGPSFIALGGAIGAGEWLLGPLNVGQSGFHGIGWIITVSALLQVGYLIECSRYVMATGEVPVVGFARVPPGTRFWVPFSLLCVYFAFIWGGWAKAAATGLFTLWRERPPGAGDSGAVEAFTILLLAVVFLITANLRRISRGLEVINGAMVAMVIGFLVVVDLLIVPASVWWEGIRGLLTPALPPGGADPTALGALAGFTAGASGLNWLIAAYYRDKGYGMGQKVGYLAGMRGGESTVRPVGVTFPDDAENASRWRRWMGFLHLEMWGIFFVGAVFGMLLPTVLVRHLVLATGTVPDAGSIPTFAAEQLGAQYGGWMLSATLLVGFLVMFSTQLVVFEAMVRTVTDATAVAPRLQERLSGGLRKLYFSFMAVLVVVIAVVLHFFQPVRLIEISGNMASFAAVVFSCVFLYLNRRLPRTARPSRWGTAALVGNAVFFGIFFVNFLWNELTGGALVAH